jgi:hypothetical protein
MLSTFGWSPDKSDCAEDPHRDYIVLILNLIPNGKSDLKWPKALNVPSESVTFIHNGNRNDCAGRCSPFNGLLFARPHDSLHAFPLLSNTFKIFQNQPIRVLRHVRGG